MTQSPATVRLKPGRDKSLRRRHPWVFSGAVAQVAGSPASGATVMVLDANGEPLGHGAYSPQSQIVVRMWNFEPAEPIDASWFRARLEQAVQWRSAYQGGRGACRLVNSESDGLPGVIIDRYADFLVCQFGTAGAEFWRTAIVESLSELSALLAIAGIYERSDLDIRPKEGLAPRLGVLAGSEPPPLLEIEEFGLRFAVDVHSGHKTGFYLDQRVNRALVSQHAQGAEVLNCFAYSGGFGLAALQGGATRVVNVDSSAPALELSQHNAGLNGFQEDQIEMVEGNVFQVLRQFQHEGRQFDLIVLDPPKFVESRERLNRATRGYKDINLHAFRLLRPGGQLFTFSCSGLLEPALFQKIVADAALDAGRSGQILAHLEQAPDHPVLLSFPEGNYLKGLHCRVE